MGKSFDLRVMLRFGLVVLATALFAQTFEFRQLTESAFGPATWPRIVLILLALSAAADSYFSRRRSYGNRSAEDPTLDWREISYLVVLFAAYVGGMTVVGFPLGTALFCVAFLMLHGFREPKWVLLIGLGIAGAMILLFVKVLYLSLPRGIWVFYDLTNFLLEFIGR